MTNLISLLMKYPLMPPPYCKHYADNKGNLLDHDNRACKEYRTNVLQAQAEEAKPTILPVQNVDKVGLVALGSMNTSAPLRYSHA